jgi:hypothetical protein
METSARPAVENAPRSSLTLACCCLALLFGASAHSQSYSVGWFKTAGGGGTSTNGQFSLSGTIGQHDAGQTTTNSQFSVTGGFWVLPQAVQTEGAPTLTITPAGPGYATISWTPNSSGYVLQESWSLSDANWTNSPSGPTNPVTLPTGTPAKYFRLRRL